MGYVPVATRRVLLLLLPALSISCAFDAGKPVAQLPAADGPSIAALAPSGKPFPPVATGAFHNAHRVTDKVIAGDQPEGDRSFQALRDLGIKTIISVDGATPDVERAEKFGLRYVHLPIEYSGVTDQQGKALAKAIDELPGPIYLHCHHGKHRSAAAAAVACVGNGSLPADRAMSVLETFGTGANYRGLWKAAADARPLAPEVLREVKVVYVSAARIPPLADAMVKVDQRFEQMKAIQKAAWKTPAEHPDLDPPHQALILEEILRELGRTTEVQARPASFRRMLGEGESAAGAMRAALASNPPDTAAASGAFKRTAQSCIDCHKAYRD